MIIQTSTAVTNALQLDEFVERLTHHPSVAGIIFGGSTATDALKPWSDYDVLVVFDELPAPLRLVTTWVEGRLTEVFCTTTETVQRIAATPVVPTSGEEAAVVRWLRSGRIVHDPLGVLRAAQEAAGTMVRIAEPTDREVFDAWRMLGYSVAQMQRYLAAREPESGLAVDMRLTYGLADVMVRYFTVRRFPWQGEKAAIRYWTESDPAFLDRFRACLAETDRRRKVERYEELARLVVAPVGELWGTGTTTIDLGWGYATGADEVDVSQIDSTLRVWNGLFGDGVALDGAP